MQEEALRRIFNWMNGKKDFPYSIELAPTLRCNLNCLFCWRYGKCIDHSDELTLEDYKRIVREASLLNVREVRIIGGGEPMLRPETFEIMKEIKKFKMFGYICTNGTFFNEKIIRTLVEIGWDHVKISIHGSNAKTHDELVGKKGAFEKSIQALKEFVKVKRELHAKKPHLEIGVVLVNRNYRQIPEIFKLARNIGVDSVFIEPITVYTEMGKTLVLNEDESEEFIEIAKKTFLEFKNIKTNLNFFFESKAHEYTGRMDEFMREKLKLTDSQNKFLKALCYEPFWRMGIRVDGTVCPCGFYDVTSKENVKYKSLKEIWFGEYFERRRKEVLDDRLPPHCKKCCTTLVKNNLMIRKKLLELLSKNL